MSQSVQINRLSANLISNGRMGRLFCSLACITLIDFVFLILFVSTKHLKRPSLLTICVHPPPPCSSICSYYFYHIKATSNINNRRESNLFACECIGLFSHIQISHARQNTIMATPRSLLTLLILVFLVIVVE